MAGAAAGQLQVLVADGQPLFRQALVRAIRQAGGFRIVAEVASGRAALDAILELRPDVAIVDVDVPDLDGPGLLRALARASSPTRVVLVATTIEPERAHAALVAGADGYLPRSADATELAAAVRAVAAGRTALAPEAQTALAAAIVARSRHDHSPLTPRQLRILELAADGASTRDIAARLRIGPGAVKSDLARAYERLAVGDRAAAVAAAIRRGLIR